MSAEAAPKVEYCMVRWNIENFSVGPWKENSFIESHEFSVSTTSPVKWNLKFYPYEKWNGKQCVSLYLKRGSSDTGPENLPVWFKFWIPIGHALEKYNSWWEDDCEYAFKKNEKFGFRTIPSLERILESGVLLNDILPICCEILIKAPITTPEKTEADLNSFFTNPPRIALWEYAQPALGGQVTGVVGVCIKNRTRSGRDHFRLQNLGHLSDMEIQFSGNERVKSESLLSKELKAFYEKKKICDLAWNIEGKDIKVHKAMLFSRSRVLAGLLDAKTSSGGKIKLPSESHEAIDSFFSFLYSGDLKDILKKPLIGIYECADNFSVADLMQTVTPDQISCLTTIQAEECEFTWVIENFSKLKINPDESISSMPLNKGTSKMAVWQLKIYPEGKSNTLDCIGVFAEVVEGTKTLQASLEISFLDSSGENYNIKHTISSTSAEGIIGFPYFIKKDDLRREKSLLLPNDTLRIHCKIKSSAGAHSNKIDNHTLTIVTRGHSENSFLTLSDNLDSLYNSRKFSDVCLIAGDKKFKCHQFILAARSSVFDCMFEHSMQEKESGVVKIPDMDASILEIMLRYMYSGKLCVLTADIALGLYPAAGMYNLQHLKEICSTFLRENLQVDSVCSALALADLYGDTILKKEAMNFACSNAEKVFTREDWKMLENEKKYLTLEVLFRRSLEEVSLSKGYRDAKHPLKRKSKVHL